MDDGGREFHGSHEIGGWSDAEFIGVHVTLQYTEVERADAADMIATVGGDGFNGPSHFTFVVDGERVATDDDSGIAFGAVSEGENPLRGAALEEQQASLRRVAMLVAVGRGVGGRVRGHRARGGAGCCARGWCRSFAGSATETATRPWHVGDVAEPVPHRLQVGMGTILSLVAMLEQLACTPANRSARGTSRA